MKKNYMLVESKLRFHLDKSIGYLCAEELFVQELFLVYIVKSKKSSLHLRFMSDISEERRCIDEKLFANTGAYYLGT